MFKYTANVFLGILVVLVPFSGFPRSWRTFLLVLIGVLIVCFSYLARRERRLVVSVARRTKEKTINITSIETSIQTESQDSKQNKLPRQQEVFAHRSASYPASINPKPSFYNIEAYPFDNLEEDLEEDFKIPQPTFVSVAESSEEKVSSVVINVSPKNTLPENLYIAPIVIESSASVPTPRRKRKTLASTSSTKIKAAVKEKKPAAKSKLRSSKKASSLNSIREEE